MSVWNFKRKMTSPMNGKDRLGDITEDRHREMERLRKGRDVFMLSRQIDDLIFNGA